MHGRDKWGHAAIQQISKNTILHAGHGFAPTPQQCSNQHTSSLGLRREGLQRMKIALTTQAAPKQQTNTAMHALASKRTKVFDGMLSRNACADSQACAGGSAPAVSR